VQIFYDNHRHIICVPYNIAQLHEMARLLGIKRCWYHANPYPHYDIPKRWVSEFRGIPSKLVTTRELLGIIKSGNLL
jgi:hypothetical protein